MVKDVGLWSLRPRFEPGRDYSLFYSRLDRRIILSEGLSVANILPDSFYQILAKFGYNPVKTTFSQYMPPEVSSVCLSKAKHTCFGKAFLKKVCLETLLNCSQKIIIMYSIACLIPDVDPISEIRAKYYPFDHHPHITLVYPFDLSYEHAVLHVEKTLKKVHPFNITLEGLSKSEIEFYLYLNITEGRSDLLNLHKRLHSGVLKNNLIPIPIYIPHLTLGVLDSEKDLDNVMASLDSFSLTTRVNSIELIHIETGNYDSFPL